MSAGAAARSYLSIGEVLGQLRAEFSDVTISKIRFLEAEGLVEPERTAAGYRKFSHADVVRLRYVLQAQRDQYLPLRVIKDHLDAIDRGLEPPASRDAAPRLPRALVAADPGMPGADQFRPDPARLRLTRDELLTEAELEPEQLKELESYGLVRAGAHGAYDGDALAVASTVAKMARFGIEARHLRPFKAAADREVGLVEQVVTPLVRGRGPEAQARAEEAVRELAALSVQLHAGLVRTALGPSLRR